MFVVRALLHLLPFVAALGPPAPPLCRLTLPRNWKDPEAIRLDPREKTSSPRSVTCNPNGARTPTLAAPVCELIRVGVHVVRTMTLRLVVPTEAVAVAAIRRKVWVQLLVQLLW